MTTRRRSSVRGRSPSPTSASSPSPNNDSAARRARRHTQLDWPPLMGAWYAIGVLAGVGAAFGLGAAVIVPRWLVAAVPAAGLGVAVGLLASHWPEAVGGGVGGVTGALGAAPVVAGALRRGG